MEISMSLVNYRGTLVHKDCVSVLEKIDKQGKGLGLSPIKFVGAPITTDKVDNTSALHSGREIHIHSDNPIEQIWALVIPHGLIPWNRYPVNDDRSHIFHYYGKWATLIDALHSDGQGEFAWGSFCCASLIDSGNWTGDKLQVRTIQCLLHLLGEHCGPIDGTLNERTVTGLKRFGLLQLPLDQVINRLHILKDTMKDKVSRKDTTVGFLYLDTPCEVFTSGDIQSVRTNMGYKFHIGGDGKIITVLNGGE